MRKIKIEKKDDDIIDDLNIPDIKPELNTDIKSDVDIIKLKKEKEKPRTDIEKIIDKLGLDNKLNKKHFRQKKYNKVFYEIPHKEDYNEMADLIHFPKTKDGYKYLFVIVDLYTFEFDIEPVKSNDSSSVLEAMMKCFKRKPNYVNKPYASLNTDGGSEFKKVFHAWVFNENIYHKVSNPYRHKQQSNVESLNRQLTKLIMLYLNKNDDGDWVKILSDIRIELNIHRKKLFEKAEKKYNKYNIDDQNYKDYPKFKIGDVVHFKLDYPENKHLDKQTSENFRSGDYIYSHVTRKIINIIYMETYPFYRYLLEGKPNVSYSEYELIPAKVDYSTYKVNKIIGKKTEKKIIYYLVWYKKELKKNASWEPKTNLLEDGLLDYINEFEKENREQQIKERIKRQNKQVQRYEKEQEKIKDKSVPVIRNEQTRYNLRSRQ